MDASVTFSRVSFNTCSLDKDSHADPCVGERVRGSTGAGVGSFSGTGASVGVGTGIVTGTGVGLTGSGVVIEAIGADVFGGVVIGALDVSLVGLFVGFATGDDVFDGIDIDMTMLTMLLKS